MCKQPPSGSNATSPGTCFVLIVTTLVFWIPRPAAAELDPALLGALKQTNQPLRWDNVALTPYWLDGATARRGLRLRDPIYRLPPLHGLRLVLPRGEMLRVVCPGGRLSEDALEFRVDNGSGLEWNHPPRTSNDGTSLWIAPDSSRTSIVRLLRPATACGAIDVAVYVSRRERASAGVSHNRPITTDAQPVTITEEPNLNRQQVEAQTWHRVDAFVPCEATITGPTRLVVETLLRYRPGEQQMEETYQIALRLDERLVRRGYCLTTADTRNPPQINGRTEVVGLVERVYLTVPAGRHCIRTETTADVYLRILALESGQLALPRFNSAAQPRANSKILAVERSFPWELTAEDFAEMSFRDAIFPALAERFAWRSARDNHYRDGGLEATLLLREASLTRPELPDIRRRAQRFRALHTYYRDLRPSHSHIGRQSYDGWFTTSDLEPPTDSLQRPVPPRLVLAEGHLDDALDRLSSARFHRVGTTEETANVYRRAHDRSATVLRVAVQREPDASLGPVYIQFDRRMPLVLHLQRSAYKGSPGNSRLLGKTPSLVDAALAVQAYRDGTTGMETLRGPFARFREGAPLVDVGYAELFLPAAVSEVRVWSAAAPGSEQLVALQQRVSRPFRMSETQLLAMCRMAGQDGALDGLIDGPAPVLDLRYRQAMADTPLDDASFARREIANHLAEWTRGLEADRQQYSAPIANRERSAFRVSASRPVASKFPSTEPSVSGASELPSGALAVLEESNRALHDSPGAAGRRRAVLRRADALAELGEEFLHERQLRGTFLHDADPRLRSQAEFRLRDLYVRQKNDVALTGMEAVAVLRGLQADTGKTARDDTLIVLARAELRQGNFEAALWSALLVALDRRPLDVVLSASYRLRWWQTFQTHLAMLVEPSRRAFWEAQFELARGNYDSAEAFFSEAGSEGAALSRHLAEGRMIAKRLRAEDLLARAEAVFDWERWQAAHPGPNVWREATACVVDCKSTAVVRAIQTDRKTDYFTADPDTPVRLSVLGPVRLKLEMRPVHPTRSATTRDDWITVRTPGRFWPVVVLNNRVSEGLEQVDLPARGIGTRVEFEVQLGPGRHEFLICPQGTETLVRTLVERPEFPLPVLPPIGEDVLHAVLAGERAMSARSPQQAVQVVNGQEGSTTDFSLPAPRRGRVRFPAKQLTPLPPLVAHRLALRLGRPYTTKQGDVLNAVQRLLAAPEVSSDEKILAAEMGGVLRDPQFGAETSLSRMVRPQAVAVLMAQGKTTAAARWELEPTDEGRRRRMALWLYLSERDLKLAPLCRVLGEALMNESPHTAGLERIYHRLVAGAQWHRITDVQQSAGVHRIALSGQTSESPRQRVRHALLPPLTAGEYRLTGDQALVLSLENVYPITVRMTLQGEHLAYLPDAPILVEWQFDDRPPERTILSTSEPYSMTVSLGEGSRYLRARLVEPFANQFVRIGLMQRAHDIARARQGPRSRQGWTPVLRELPRDYLVASAEEPVRIAVSGPAWVRIDRRDGEITTSRYRLVLEPLETLTLHPPEGGKRALYRVFRRRYVKAAPKREQFVASRELARPAGPLLTRYRIKQDRNASPGDPTYLGISTEGSILKPSPAGNSLTRAKPATQKGSQTHAHVARMPQHKGLEVPDRLRTTIRVLADAVPNHTPQWLKAVPSVAFAGQPIQAETGPVPIETQTSSSSSAPSQAEVEPIVANTEATGLDRLDLSMTQPSALFRDVASLGRQQRGTWSLNTGWYQRRAMEESETQSEPDEFMQFGATHRYFSRRHNIYSTTDMHYRDRIAGGSLGARNALWHESSRLPLTYLMDTRAYLQSPGGAVFPEHNDSEWSFYWRGGLTGQRRIHDCLWLTHTGSTFVRALSLEDNPYPVGRVDQDIHTPYKSDHRHGLLLAETLTWQPWRDTQFRLRGSLGTNEDFNPFSPDYVSGRLGWRQLVGSVDFEMAYRATRYFDDPDRSRNSTQHVVGLDLTWDVWSRRDHLGQLDFLVQHDLSKGTTSLGVGMSIYFDAGRGYRDFAPNQLRFQSLKRRRESFANTNYIDMLLP